MATSPSIPVQSYRDLIAWQKAMALAREVYRITETFPRVETYGLIAQLRRAAVSIPSKIAEGHEHATGDYRNFLGHALGALMEIETQLLLSEDLSYLEKQKAECLLARTAELAKILHGLSRSLRIRINSAS
ncbi:MAG TPA: four helix bundle protein [Candidatus Sulfotelmatobacter sp.]|nr:four helix bundle protein [Candidatus Sulfotelmatobacter sp.]